MVSLFNRLFCRNIAALLLIACALLFSSYASQKSYKTKLFSSSEFSIDESEEKALDQDTTFADSHILQFAFDYFILLHKNYSDVASISQSDTSSLPRAPPTA